MECPKCKAPMWRAVLGYVCPDCGLTIDIAKRCKTCGTKLRLRLDGKPGLWCDKCRCDDTPLEAITKDAPYRSAAHALYSLIWATAQASGAPSELGPKLERLELGYVQTSGRRQLGREHEIIGELAAPWSRLDGEDQVLLWEWGSSAMWLEQAVVCSCGREYVPTWLKHCEVCGRIRCQDEQLCQCGAHHWSPIECCPRCGRKDAHTATTRARRTARAVSGYRRALFERDHGRAPFRKGQSENEAENFNESERVGYCWRCKKWKRDSEVMSGKRCKVCKQRVPWGITVSDVTVTKMVPSAMHRWADVIEGLIGKEDTDDRTD